MAITLMLHKRTILREYKIAVETEWVRIPMVNTADSSLCRKGMQERVGYDPLSIKSTILYSVRGKRIEHDKHDNPKSLGAVYYSDATTKEDLKLAHKLVVSAIEAGLLPSTRERLDLWLQEQHHGELVRKLTSYLLHKSRCSEDGLSKDSQLLA